jgi:uncharacterized Tic20 family protein
MTVGMEQIHFVLRLVLAYLGAVGAYMGGVVLWKLYKHGEKAMASFQLQPDEAIEDFKIMLAAEAFMIIGFLIYFIGGATESSLFLNIGRTYAVIFCLFALRISYRWWGRF